MVDKSCNTRIRFEKLVTSKAWHYCKSEEIIFQFKKIKNKINAIEDGDMDIDQVDHIAKKLNVSKKDVIDMNRRMTNQDQSLNAPIGKTDGESGNGKTFLPMKEVIKKKLLLITKN